jgi:hypothetical protein
LLADARDVARIAGAPLRNTQTVLSVASGVARWRRRIERLRSLAVVRRALIVAGASACLLQLVALAAGRAHLGLWLVPALLVALVCLVPGLANRTSASTAARMLDRDLGLGAGVTTALELEREAGIARGLAGLALEDGRNAVADSLSGARARLRPRHAESLLLVAIAGVLGAMVLVPAPGRGGTQRALGAPRGDTRHAIATGDDATRQQAGPDLRGYRQQNGSSRSQRAAGTRSTPSGAGTGSHGAGTASGTHTGSVQPASRTVGNAGYLQTSRTSSSTAPPSTSKGTTGHGSIVLGSHETPAAGSLSSSGVKANTTVANAQQADGSTTTGGIPGKANTAGGHRRGGGRSAAAGATPAGAAEQGTPGGATAGATRSAQQRATGVVPQLGANRQLPLQAGLQAIRGTKASGNEHSASSANGAGGASRSDRASIAGSATGAGVAYVPPGGSSIAPADRRLLIGYFGSFARVSAAGW